MEAVEAIHQALAIQIALFTALKQGCYVEAHRRWLVWQRTEFVVYSRESVAPKVVYAGTDLEKALQIIQEGL